MMFRKVSFGALLLVNKNHFKSDFNSSHGFFPNSGSFICCYAGNLLTEQTANEAGENLGDEYFAELDYIEVMENYKEGYEEEAPEVTDESADDEDFDYAKASRANNDDSDDDFVSSHCSTSVPVKKAYRTRQQNKESTSRQKEAKNKQQKKQNNGSDDDDNVRQVRSIMASDSVSMYDDDDDRSKSLRKLFGPNENVYIMDAKKAGNIGRYFNVSFIRILGSKILCYSRILLQFHFLFPAFVWSQFICAKCVCRYARSAISLGCVFYDESRTSWNRTHLELQL